MKELFKQGVSFRTFILNQDTATRGKFMRYYIPMEINDALRTRVNQINKKVNILGVVEGLSEDCHINLTILEKLISTNHNISLSLITKKDAGNQLDNYQEDNTLKVPTFIFMDEAYDSKAAYIEKPNNVLHTANAVGEDVEIMKAYKEGKLVEEIATELLELIEKTA